MNGRIREALEHCLGHLLTFVAFRVPGHGTELWVQEGRATEELSIDLLAKLKDRFVIAPYDLGTERLLTVRPDRRILFGSDGFALDEWPEVDPPVPIEHDNGPLARPSFTKEQFSKAIDLAKDAFVAGEMEKVVLSREITTACPKELLPWLFADAVDQRPGALVVLVHAPTIGTWLGASPERLLHAEGEEVTADALAGTLPSASAPRSPEAWGSKEREEQEMVARTVLNTFMSAGVENISARGPEVVDAGPVAHLRSTISAQLAGRSLTDLLTALHPTPAVCGSPRSAAQAFIAQHEPQRRQLYTGFWGPWRTDRRTDLYVNIRCLHATNDQAVISVGAGITAGSDAEREWQETENKARTWTQPIEVLLRGRVS